MLHAFMEPSDPSKPDSPTNLDGIASHFSAAFYKTLRAAGAGVESGEARHNAAVDERVLEATIDQNPKFRIIAKGLEKAGLSDLINIRDLQYLAKQSGGSGLLSGGSSSGSTKSLHGME